MNPERARAIRLLALDVDGVLTDGRISYSDKGDELKSFNIKDGLGIKLLQRSGIEVAIITGRRSAIVERRARELGIETIMQGREDKLVALRELCAERNVGIEECAYMGDDLPDLAAIQAAGLGPQRRRRQPRRPGSGGLVQQSPGRRRRGARSLRDAPDSSW